MQLIESNGHGVLEFKIQEKKEFFRLFHGILFIVLGSVLGITKACFLFIILFFFKCFQVTQESIMYIKDFGIQIHSKNYLYETSQFYPLEKIKGIWIQEVIQHWQVFTVLMMSVEHEKEIVCFFSVSFERLMRSIYNLQQRFFYRFINNF